MLWSKNKMFNQKPQKTKKLLIIRLDQIGDYVLFRNFLEIVKNSEKYAGYEITLLGNPAWKDIAENFDNKFIDNFVWMNKRYFRKYGWYRKFLAFVLNRKSFDEVISPVYSREEQWTENIVKLLKCKEKTCGSGNYTNISIARKIEMNRNYSKIIKQSPENLFEFERNKEFFENLLNEKIPLEKTHFNLDEKKFAEIDFDFDSKYVILFPGANAKNRRWNYANFTKIADFITQKYGYKIIIAGNKKDGRIASKIISQAQCKNNISDITSKFKLSEIPYIFNKAQLIISNDTAGFHIASSVNENVICLSNGNTFGRFCPYPKNYDNNLTIFPPIVEKNLDNTEFLEDNCRYYSNFDINDIQFDTVIKAIEKVLHEI